MGLEDWIHHGAGACGCDRSIQVTWPFTVRHTILPYISVFFFVSIDFWCSLDISQIPTQTGDLAPLKVRLSRGICTNGDKRDSSSKSLGLGLLGTNIQAIFTYTYSCAVSTLLHLPYPPSISLRNFPSAQFRYLPEKASTS